MVSGVVLVVLSQPFRAHRPHQRAVCVSLFYDPGLLCRADPGAGVHCSERGTVPFSRGERSLVQVSSVLLDGILGLGLGEAARQGNLGVRKIFLFLFALGFT